VWSSSIGVEVAESCGEPEVHTLRIGGDIPLVYPSYEEAYQDTWH
jgi:hypothetical protein